MFFKSGRFTEFRKGGFFVSRGKIPGYGLIIKLAIFLLVLAFAGPFFLKDKNGNPLMSFAKIKAKFANAYYTVADTLPLKGKSKTETDPGTKNLESEKYVPYADKDYTEMYKYKDEKGVTHFTDQKPIKYKYEVMYMPVSKENDLKTKLIKKLTGKKDKPKRILPKKKGKESSDLLSQAKDLIKNATEHYKQAPKALNDAKDLKKQVEATYEERDKMMQELQQ